MMISSRHSLALSITASVSSWLPEKCLTGGSVGAGVVVVVVVVVVVEVVVLVVVVVDFVVVFVVEVDVGEGFFVDVSVVIRRVVVGLVVVGDGVRTLVNVFTSTIETPT